MAEVFGEIKIDRILRSHLCHMDRTQCTDPDAHFRGTDEEWLALVEQVRCGPRVGGGGGGFPPYNALSEPKAYCREDDMTDTTELGVSRILRVGPRSG